MVSHTHRAYAPFTHTPHTHTHTCTHAHTHTTTTQVQGFVAASKQAGNKAVYVPARDTASIAAAFAQVSALIDSAATVTEYL